MKPNNSPLVTLTDFRKRFGTKPLFDIPKFSFPTGINRLIGKNGAGKTTLLRIIAGLSTYEGMVTLFGEMDIRRSPTRHRQWVNFSESEPVYPEKARGKDLLTIFSKAHRAAPSQSAELIERFQMHDYLSTPIGTYSAGMKKKLSLLLAFVGSPRLILLDEPFITIDKAAQAELREIIAREAANGCSFILSTHGDLNHPGLAGHPVFKVSDGGIKQVPNAPVPSNPPSSSHSSSHPSPPSDPSSPSDPLTS